jgi:thiamine-monophosphate kinase
VTTGPRRARGAAIEERAFHAWLARALPRAARGPLPLGDDAAAVPLPRGAVAVVSTDALVEGTHFLPTAPPRLVGRAATAVSLSDVAAKGATPLAVFLAVIVPRGTPRAWAEELVLGAEEEASRFGAHLLGGDTKPGPVRAVASTVVGEAPSRRLVGRRGARPGEVLVTTGEVGRGGAAAHALRARGRARARAIAGLLAVHPRVREGRALGRYASAMLDTSDGLAESCRLLADASGVRVEVVEASLPLVPALRRVRAGAARRAAAFYGGDYELLAAVPPRRLGAAERAVRAVGGRLRAIGAVARGRGAFLLTVSGPVPMPPAGWQPFGRGFRDVPRRAAALPRGVIRYRRPHGTFK